MAILMAVVAGGGGCFAHGKPDQVGAPLAEETAAIAAGPTPGDDELARRYLDTAADLRARGAEALTASFDFATLRRGYVHALVAHPDLAVPERLRRRLADAIDGDVPADVLRAAHAILDHDVTDTRAHVVSALLLEQTGRAAAAHFHRVVAAGLFASMKISGDGRAPASAYVVYQLKEEFELLRVLALAPIRQRSVADGGRLYDQLRASDVNDPAAPCVTLYFDISELAGNDRGLVASDS
jgi:hypothetical protein